LPGGGWGDIVSSWHYVAPLSHLPRVGARDDSSFDIRQLTEQITNREDLGRILQNLGNAAAF
jgi:hypothetical protein